MTKGRWVSNCGKKVNRTQPYMVKFRDGTIKDGLYWEPNALCPHWKDRKGNNYPYFGSKYWVE